MTISGLPDKTEANVSLTIDLDRRIVTTSMRAVSEAAITEITENTITFEGSEVFGKPEPWKGSVDRHSGSAFLNFHPTGLGIPNHYELRCKSAKPLF